MTIYHQEAGQGPAVVLLHGFCEDNSLWNGLIDALAHDYRVLAPDLPGFGKSNPLEDKVSIERVADVIKAWMDHHHLNDVHLIGHSLGGYVALALADKYPEALASLGLFHSTAYADTIEKKGTRDNVISFVRNNGVQKFISSFVSPLFHYSNRSDLKDIISSMIEIGKQVDEDVLIEYTEAMRDRVDRRYVLRNFKNPILFIAGAEDSAVPRMHSENQIEELHADNCVLLDNTCHMGMYERKAETEHFIKGFLQRAESLKTE
ncbi:alpha/beta fold hydrolase [Marinigracilibium pacificum]|uniref:Alpha/beta fold hydrolase n=1 Tax=Marinigracilibium pacificum TaxID=2729599 RepID=A0A848IVW5_9BACT|nr:alpha/beta fold hydrolase [Marinigracilibium pacificum]NMM47415.1 alpha/beta fold hydrolase [Marinigracilibium pacificum]